MSHIETSHFGTLAVDPSSAVCFPAGLPGFEDERSFVLVEIPEYAPLIFVQSTSRAGLCFLAMPVLSVDPEYRLEVAPEDLVRIGLDPRRAPVIGREVLCLALVTVSEDAITANLRAPLVMALDGRRAVQSIQPEGNYSHRHPLACEAPACS